MAVCDPNSILEEGACFDCLTPYQLELIQAQLLCNLLNISDPMASCDPNALLEEARCFNCLNSHQLRIVIAQLLCNIVDGGGVGSVQVYTGAAPPAAPADPTRGAVFYPDGGGTMQQWDVISQTWV